MLNRAPARFALFRNSSRTLHSFRDASSLLSRLIQETKLRKPVEENLDSKIEFLHTIVKEEGDHNRRQVREVVDGLRSCAILCSESKRLTPQDRKNLDVLWGDLVNSVCNPEFLRQANDADFVTLLKAANEKKSMNERSEEKLLRSIATALAERLEEGRKRIASLGAIVIDPAATEGERTNCENEAVIEADENDLQTLALDSRDYESIDDVKYTFAKHIKSFLRSYAIACERDPELTEKPEIKKVVHALSRVASNIGYGPTDLSAVVWASAVCGEARHKVFDAYEKMIMAADERRGLVPGVKNPDLTARAENDSFTALSVYHLIWAFAFAECFHSEPLANFLVKRQIAKFKDLELSRVATVLRSAALGCGHSRNPQVFFSVEELFRNGLPMLTDLTKLNPKDVAQLSIAVTKLGQCAPAVGQRIPDISVEFSRYLREYLLKFCDGTPRQADKTSTTTPVDFNPSSMRRSKSGKLLSVGLDLNPDSSGPSYLADSYFRSILWAVSWFKRDKQPDRVIFMEVARRLMGNSELPIEDISTMVWCMSRLKSREFPLDVLKYVSKRLENSAATLTPPCLSSVIFSFAKLGVWSDELGEILVPRIIELLPQCTSSELSSIIWAYAVSAQLVPDLIVAFTNEVLNRPKATLRYEPRNILSIKDNWVCKWSLAILLDECPEVLQPFDIFDRIPGLNDRDTNGMAACTFAPVHSSAVHGDVSRRLNLLGVNHTNEFSIDNLMVDIALPDQKVVLEVDGVYHFVLLPDGSKRYDGPTQWKHRKLREAGWTVVSVDTREYELNKNKKYFLRDALLPYVGESMHAHAEKGFMRARR